MDSEGRLHLLVASEALRVAAEKKLTPVARPITKAERKNMKIGRNSPCGCGSGKKFKRCCYGKPWTELREPI